MKQPSYFVTSILIALLMIHNLFAQDQPSEPVELTRLREQFQHKIDQEMKPWREKYAQELQKLEDRLIKDRKLVEALAVKKEKENYLTVSLEKKLEGVKSPATSAEAAKEIAGSVWLVYAGEDKKRENLLDVFYFKDDAEVYINSVKKTFSWIAKTKDEVVVKYSQGEILMEIDFLSKKANIEFYGKSYVYLMAGKPPVEK